MINFEVTQNNIYYYGVVNSSYLPSIVKMDIQTHKEETLATPTTSNWQNGRCIRLVLQKQAILFCSIKNAVLYPLNNPKNEIDFKIPAKIVNQGIDHPIYDLEAFGPKSEYAAFLLDKRAFCVYKLFLKPKPRVKFLIHYNLQETLYWKPDSLVGTRDGRFIAISARKGGSELYGVYLIALELKKRKVLLVKRILYSPIGNVKTRLHSISVKYYKDRNLIVLTGLEFVEEASVMTFCFDLTSLEFREAEVRGSEIGRQRRLVQFGGALWTIDQDFNILRLEYGFSDD